jgi:hypothetical protein
LERFVHLLPWQRYDLGSELMVALRARPHEVTLALVGYYEALIELRPSCPLALIDFEHHALTRRLLRLTSHALCASTATTLLSNVILSQFIAKNVLDSDVMKALINQKMMSIYLFDCLVFLRQ